MKQAGIKEKFSFFILRIEEKKNRKTFFNEEGKKKYH
jgi:hypothetical protein